MKILVTVIICLFSNYSIAAELAVQRAARPALSRALRYAAGLPVSAEFALHRVVKPALSHARRCFSSSASDLPDGSDPLNTPSLSETSKSSDIVMSLKRVLTIGEENYHPVEEDFRSAFFYNHLLQRWHISAEDDKDSSESILDKAPKKFHTFKSFPDKDFEKFHSAVSKRLPKIPPKFHANHLQVGLHAKEKPYSKESEKIIDENLLAKINSDSPFVDGQIIPLKGKMAFPLNLISISQEGSPQIKFGLPLQNGFYFQTLEDYYKYAALLRRWSSYSHLRIITIPAGTHINCRVGLIASQSFPKPTDFKYLLEGEEVPAKLSNIAQLLNLKSDLETLVKLRPELNQAVLSDDPSKAPNSDPFKNLIDHHHGGEIQIMFGYVEKCDVYEFDSLCVDNQRRAKKYLLNLENHLKILKEDLEKLKKDPKMGKKQTEDDLRRLSHFLDSDYFKTSFILEDILCEMEVINETERGEISGFLKEIRQKQTDLKRLKKEKNHEN